MKKPKLFSVIGTPVAHSISPAMHNCAFDHLGINAHYIAVDTKERKLSDIVAAMVTLGFSGWNVTMPDKTEMAGLCDTLSDEARIIGAVNTVENRDGHLIGHSTDGIGFFRNLREHGFNPEGKKVVLLGAGGAARSIAARATQEGLSELIIYNRTLKKAEDLVSLLKKEDSGIDLLAKPLEKKDELESDIRDADLIVNATSIGMGSDDSVIDYNWLEPKTTVTDSARRCKRKYA